ncbi:MAG: RidA family protein [Nitrososphaerales archaeon]
MQSESNPHLYFISGQSPTNERGKTVGVGDFEVQVVQCFENLRRCLDSIGASFDDLLKLNILIVPMDEFDIVRSVRSRYLNPKKLPSITSSGVTSLVKKDWLIEIEAVVETRQRSLKKNLTHC